MKLRIGSWLLASLISVTAYAAGPTLSDSPYMDQRLHEGVTLKGPVTTLPSTGTVVEVQTPDHSLLGSATRVCLNSQTNPDPSRSWYLTNSHVAETADRLNVAGSSSLAVYFIDSSMDLALLSGPRTNAPCAELASRLIAPAAYDIEAVGSMPTRRIQIEAFDREHGKIERREIHSVIASAWDSGMSGREGTGPMLMLNARGLHGMSGGAVISRLDPDGNPEFSAGEKGIFVTPQFELREKLIGLVMASDNEGRKMMAIPAPIIYQRLKLFKSDPKKYGSLRTEKSVEGGVQYLDSGAIHYRSPDRFLDVSAHAIELSGKGGDSSGKGGDSSGKGGDSSGKGGDSSGKGGDSSGKGGDSSGKGGDSGRTLRKAAPFSSGIVTPDRPGRRWVSIGRDWSETESLFPALRARLKNPQTLEGIYEEKGQLYSTSPHAPIPDWLSIPDAFTSDHAFDIDLSGQEKVQRAWKNLPPLPCKSTIGISREKGTEKNFGTLVVVCEKETPTGRSLGMTVFPLPRKESGGFLNLFSSAEKLPKPISFKVDLIRQCPAPSPSAGAAPCPIEMKARVFEESAKFPFEDKDHWLQWTQQHLQALPESQGRAMKNDGLRRFVTGGFSIELDASGGYRIQTREGDGLQIITGPSTGALSPVRQELMSEAAAARSALLMNQAFSAIQSTLTPPHLCPQ